jgi:hypothetical protein
MVDVLLGFIRIVPLDDGLESPCLRIEFHRCEIRSHDAFERVDNCARPQTVDWIGPRSAIAEADRVVVSVGETEPHQEPAGRLGTERVDQLLSQQAHRGGAEDDHPLLVKPDHAFIRPKVEQLGELQSAIVHLSTILLRRDDVQCAVAVQSGANLEETRDLLLRRRHAESSEKLELVRAFAVHIKGFQPQRLGLHVWTINVARGADEFSRATSVDHHRVVPCGETVAQTERLARADCVRHRSIDAHRHTHPRTPNASDRAVFRPVYTASSADVDVIK